MHGEGPCLSNSECATQGHYYFCGGQDCVDTGELQLARCRESQSTPAPGMYPLNVYPENAQIYGLVDGDKCCR